MPLMELFFLIWNFKKIISKETQEETSGIPIKVMKDFIRVVLIQNICNLSLRFENYRKKSLKRGLSRLSCGSLSFLCCLQQNNDFGVAERLARSFSVRVVMGSIPATVHIHNFQKEVIS